MNEFTFRAEADERVHFFELARAAICERVHFRLAEAAIGRGRTATLRHIPLCGRTRLPALRFLPACGRARLPAYVEFAGFQSLYCGSCLARSKRFSRSRFSGSG